MLLATGSETVLFFNAKKFQVMETKQMAVMPRTEKRNEKQSTTTLGRFQFLLQRLVDTLGDDDPDLPVLQTVSKHGNRFAVTGSTLDGCTLSFIVNLED